MIKIVISRDKDVVNKVLISGHAMFAPHGSDIVCAGVSSILTTTINGIYRLDSEAISYENKDDFVLSIMKFDNVTVTLIDNMLELFKELSVTYPKNVLLEEEK